VVLVRFCLFMIFRSPPVFFWPVCVNFTPPTQPRFFLFGRPQPLTVSPTPFLLVVPRPPHPSVFPPKKPWTLGFYVLFFDSWLLFFFVGRVRSFPPPERFPLVLSALFRQQPLLGCLLDPKSVGPPVPPPPRFLLAVQTRTARFFGLRACPLSNAPFQVWQREQLFLPVSVLFTLC